MRHRKHKHLLGVKSAHRLSLLANLCCSLVQNGRIRTTLAKAKALRPFSEKIITLAKKAYLADDSKAGRAKKLHYRRLAIARLRNKKVVQKLFGKIAEQFVNRSGGYTRIYKLAMQRRGDAAELAIIEIIEASDEGYPKRKKGKKKKPSKKNMSAAPAEKASEEQIKEESATEGSGTKDYEEIETAEAVDEIDTGESEESSETVDGEESVESGSKAEEETDSTAEDDENNKISESESTPNEEDSAESSEVKKAPSVKEIEPEPESEEKKA